jgi:alkylation response protein AidB-like acyl-CoA dehydrogenase
MSSVVRRHTGADLIYLEELAHQGIVRSVHFGGYAIVGPSLLEFGNEEQRALAGPSIRGDIVWCVGMSEPDAGSDLANLSTRAVRDGDTFVVNGQKVWPRTRRSRTSASATCAPTPTCPSTRASAC